MGTTTFTGPIKAGDILNTSGTTLGDDVANVGFVVMAQSAPVTQALLPQSVRLPRHRERTQRVLVTGTMLARQIARSSSPRPTLALVSVSSP